MRASIIINNYNYGRFLDQSVGSALAQTHPDTEVIVVDDGSTDDSLQILEAYADHIKVIAKENAGQGSCFSTGFAHCSGDIVLFLDSDDYLRSDCVETLLRHWSPPVVKAHFYLAVVDAAGHSIQSLVPSGKLAGDEALEMMRLFGSYCSPPASGNAFAASYLATILPFENEAELIYSADSVLIFSAPFFGKVIAIDDTLAFYRRHGAAGSAVKTGFDRDSSLKSLRKEHEKDLRRDRSWRMACNEYAPAPFHLMEPSRAKRRMCYLKLSEEGLEEGDTVLGLLVCSIRAIWHWKGYTLKQKGFASIWFAVVTVLPLPICEPLIRMALGLAERRPLHKWVLNGSGTRRELTTVT